MVMGAWIVAPLIHRKEADVNNDFLPLRPRRLISLWDMIEYFAESFLPIWERLDAHLCDCDASRNNEPYIGAGTAQDMKQILEALKPMLYAANLMMADNRLRDFYLLLGSPITPETLKSEIGGLQKTIIRELADKKFAFIPPGNDQFFERDDLFGKEFHDFASPEINVEIKAAGNCLAADLNTAAIFHLLRAAELGMRRMAKRLKVPVIRDNKQIEIDDATWDELIIGTNKKVKSEKELSPPQREIKNHFKEYERLAQQFDHMKNDRNNVMHTRGNNTAVEALAVLGRVKDFMLKLAERISLK
jgi:hypothetical protein